MVFYVITDVQNNEIINALRKKYKIEKVGTSNLSSVYTNSNSAGLIIDCNSSNCISAKTKTLTDMVLKNKKSVVALNINEESMIYLFGLSISCRDILVQPYENDIIINCLDTKFVYDNLGGDTQIVDDDDRTLDDIKENFDTTDSPFEKNTPFLKAEKISELVESSPNPNVSKQSVLPLATENLPPNIYKTFYVKLSKKDKISPNTDQYYNNELVFVVELVASFQNPPYKYLQITTQGAGFNPTNGKGMIYNTEYDRGIWQDNVSIVMKPKTDLLTQLSTSPKNVNDQTTYNVKSILNFDVDISKNPSFKGSYTIEKTYSTSIKDFLIINKSTPELAEWQFQLGLTAADPFKIFDESLLTVQPTVKNLPYLATQNLQPYCSATWYIENTFNDKLSIDVSTTAKLYRAFSESVITGNHTKNIRFADLKNSVQITVDFNEVNP